MLKSLTAKAGTAAAVAGVLALGLLSASPAFAGRHDDWRHHRDHDRCWNCGPRYGVAVGPPVVYAAPPAYYAPPPPVVYSPGLSFGINIR